MTVYEPLPFQLEDIAWCAHHNKHMILYDRGLGKTGVAIKRNIDAGVGTHLVVCPGNAIGTWRTNSMEWLSHHWPGYDIDVHVLRGKKPSDRKKVWDELLHPERTKQKRVFITTYGTAQRDFKVAKGGAPVGPHHFKRVDQIDLDEAHKLRSRKSANFKILQPVLRQHPYFGFLTGTPISRGAQEFWTYLNCINPKYFGSYWKHVYTFCEVIDGMWGKEIIGPRNTEAFYHLLRQFSRIRLKTDPEIAAQMPKKTRVSLECEMDSDQQRIWSELDLKKVSITDSGMIIGATSMELWMRFRQLMVCPRIFDPSLSLGGAFNDLMDTWADDPDSVHCVVFTPFRRAIEHFRLAIEERGHHVEELYGGITAEDQHQRITRWRASRGVMLCTIPYAESFDLDPISPGDATSAYFIGYEWDPNMNVQAEDRLHRLSTKYPVTINYYRYADNHVDSQMEYTVNWKNQNITSLLQGAGAR